VNVLRFITVLFLRKKDPQAEQSAS